MRGRGVATREPRWAWERGKGPRSLRCPLCADVRAVGALAARSSGEQTERSSVCMRVVSMRRSGVDGGAVRMAAGWLRSQNGRCQRRGPGSF